jgi:hypothetical protein
MILTQWSYCPGMSLEGLRKNHVTHQSLASVPDEIRTEHLQNMSIEYYHYARPFS